MHHDVLTDDIGVVIGASKYRRHLSLQHGEEVGAPPVNTSSINRKFINTICMH